MPSRPTASLDLGALLAAVEDAAPVAAVEVLARRLGAALGAREVSFLIADFSGHSLVRIGRFAGDAGPRSEEDETADRVALQGTPHGRALAAQTVELEPEAGGTRVIAPVTNRGEAIGVLELCVDAAPDEQTLTDAAAAAHALAYVVIANRRFTDLFEWGQRSVPLSLAAEIQHRLLPASYTCEAGQFTLAGWLEPAGQVGGDTFDFTMERDTLHLSMTDAMGHEVEAALLATTLVGALRNARRAGADLAEQARRANADLAENPLGDGFVTGQVARIDLRTGTAAIVNAGHPPPLRLRDGRVEEVPLEADPPFGTERDQHFRVQDLPLQPGDRLMFYTDGIIERNTTDIDVKGIVLAGADMHPREAVQDLIQAILEATGGALHDDATALCVDWHGGSERERRTDSGADRPRAGR